MRFGIADSQVDALFRVKSAVIAGGFTELTKAKSFSTVHLTSRDKMRKVGKILIIIMLMGRCSAILSPAGKSNLYGWYC